MKHITSLLVICTYYTITYLVVKFEEYFQRVNK